MKKITFKFAVGLAIIAIAGAAFITGCQLNNNSTAAATTNTQTAQKSTTITTSSGAITQASAGELSISSIYSQASPAVVEINVTIQEMGFFGMTTATDQGSGFLIDTSGDIITNNHVVEGANSIQIVLANGTTINNAHVIGTDAADDLAVVNVSASAVAGITPLQFDDSGTVVPGQTVIAIGSPIWFFEFGDRRHYQRRKSSDHGNRYL